MSGEQAGFRRQGEDLFIDGVEQFVHAAAVKVSASDSIFENEITDQGRIILLDIKYHMPG